jgi:hypothetical protein
MTGAQPTTVDCRKPRVPQPDKMVKQGGGMIRFVWKTEVVPARVDETLEELRRAQRTGLLLRLRVPLIGGKATRRGMLRINQVGDEHRSAS